ncbi:MAG TPA: hypothetical protein VFH56_05460 [Acidimicrobiales bacterium]|nr:hypothetical protein [Acidimicrobiales bacterium]
MVRPSETKAVVALLMEPADDVNELAKQIIKTVDESRQDRTDYVVVVQTGGLAHGYGFYPTVNACERAIKSGKIPSIDGSRLFVIPVRHPSQIDALWERVDESPLSEAAAKSWKRIRNAVERKTA